jgi:hypothetical protein
MAAASIFRGTFNPRTLYIQSSVAGMSDIPDLISPTENGRDLKCSSRQFRNASEF